MAEEEKQKVEETQPEKEGSRSEAKTPTNAGDAHAEKPKEAQAEKAEKPETPKKEEPPAEKTETPKKQEPPAEKPEKPKETPAGPVKPSNCTQCNKPLKRGNWYYRNGKFYCNKRCWKKTTEKVA